MLFRFVVLLNIIISDLIGLILDAYALYTSYTSSKSPYNYIAISTTTYYDYDPSILPPAANRINSLFHKRYRKRRKEVVNNAWKLKTLAGEEQGGRVGTRWRHDALVTIEGNSLREGPSLVECECFLVPLKKNFGLNISTLSSFY
jgi:hypothetical protein